MIGRRQLRVLVAGLAILATSLCLISPATASGPTVGLAPHAGPPTIAIKVSGSGFGPNQAVDIYFDAERLALAATDASGDFAGIKIRAPRSAPSGKHRVTAVERSDGLSAQAPFAVRADWNQFQVDAGHTGFNPFENEIGVGNVSRLHEAWSAPALDGISASVADGILFSSSYDDHRVDAFDARSGAPIWSHQIAKPVGGQVAYAHGVVYATGGWGPTSRLYALDASSGQKLWVRTNPSQFISGPTVANGVVYAGDDTILRAFDARTGADIWTAQINSVARSYPAVADGYVYATGRGPISLYALDEKRSALPNSLNAGPGEASRSSADRRLEQTGRARPSRGISSGSLGPRCQEEPAQRCVPQEDATPGSDLFRPSSVRASTSL